MDHFVKQTISLIFYQSGRGHMLSVHDHVTYVWSCDLKRRSHDQIIEVILADASLIWIWKVDIGKILWQTSDCIWQGWELGQVIDVVSFQNWPNLRSDSYKLLIVFSWTQCDDLYIFLRWHMLFCMASYTWTLQHKSVWIWDKNVLYHICIIVDMDGLWFKWECQFFYVLYPNVNSHCWRSCGHLCNLQ